MHQAKCSASGDDIVDCDTNAMSCREVLHKFEIVAKWKEHLELAEKWLVRMEDIAD